MASRVCFIGSLVLVLCACQKGRDEVDSTGSASGTGISAAVGVGGSGGDGSGGAASTATGSSTSSSSPSASSGGDGGAGSGGDATGSGGDAPSSGSGGAFPSTCGAEGACWGDDPTPCDDTICEIEFVECAPDEPSPFVSACGNLAVIVRVDVWAHIVDCMRAAGPDVECGAEGEAAADACFAQAFDEACPSDEVDALCDATADACVGFDVDACKRDAAILLGSTLEDYEGCLAEGGECATLHDSCF